MNNTVVCPPNLLQSLFTAGAINNIDHNTSSTAATGSGISLFQHPNEHSGGVDRREHRILARETTSKKVIELPQSYMNVMSVQQNSHQSPSLRVQSKEASCQALHEGRSQHGPPG